MGENSTSGQEEREIGSAEHANHGQTSGCGPREPGAGHSKRFRLAFVTEGGEHLVEFRASAPARLAKPLAAGADSDEGWRASHPEGICHIHVPRDVNRHHVDHGRVLGGEVVEVRLHCPAVMAPRRPEHDQGWSREVGYVETARPLVLCRRTGETANRLSTSGAERTAHAGLAALGSSCLVRKPRIA